MDTDRYEQLQPPIRAQMETGVFARLQDYERDQLADYVAAFVDNSETLVDNFNPSRRRAMADLFARVFEVAP